MPPIRVAEVDPDDLKPDQPRGEQVFPVTAAEIQPPKLILQKALAGKVMQPQRQLDLLPARVAGPGLAVVGIELADLILVGPVAAEPDKARKIQMARMNRSAE